MKTALRAICSFILAASVFAASGCSVPDASDKANENELPEISVDSEDTADAVNSNGETVIMNKLNNTYAKLTQDKALNIVYIGGSVTDGYGSSDSGTKSWVAKTNDWFKESFPDAKTVGTRCSIGGTGSYLAAFRYEKEIAPKDPDLLFIEYAVNDMYNGMGYDRVLRDSETIVRKAYEHNPNIDIVYVLTFDKRDGTADYNELKAHRDVAEHYGLISIKLSDHVYGMLSETGDDFSKYFMDTVHPNDEGYAFYASVITKTLGDTLAENAPESAKLIEKKIPDMLSPSIIGHPDMVYADKIDLADSVGFEYQGKTNFSWLGMRYNGRVFAKGIGSRLTVEFEGTDFGLCYGIGPNMGVITCTVDGGEPVVIDAYRANINPKDAVAAWDIEDGKHTATIEITSQNENSGGAEFEIGALLIG